MHYNADLEVSLAFFAFFFLPVHYLTGIQSVLYKTITRFTLTFIFFSQSVKIGSNPFFIHITFIKRDLILPLGLQSTQNSLVFIIYQLHK